MAEQTMPTLAEIVGVLREVAQQVDAAREAASGDFLPDFPAATDWLANETIQIPMLPRLLSQT